MNPIIIKRDRVRLEDEAAKPVRAPSREVAASHAPRKKVELLQHDGRVRALEITCSCGEVALVELEYSEAPARAENQGARS